MKFLCDQMLSGLGKWLRTAGYDTIIVENNLEDRKILELALQENRILLTRDRHFLEMQAPEKTVLFITGNSIQECVGELNREFKFNWLYAPFSRCLICNTLLVKSDDPRILNQAPEDVRAASHDFWYCKQCNKVYWLGSHTDHMLEQLRTWQTINDEKK